MDIKRSGSRPSGKGPADYFTGSVRLDQRIDAKEPARVRGAHVTFEPGARTAWHTHPLGQTLIITSGLGWVQRQSGPVEEIRPGDVVWFEGRETLAWGDRDHRHEPYRHPGGAERECRRMDGEGQRRCLSALRCRPTCNRRPDVA